MEIFHPTLDCNKMKVFLSPKLRDFEIGEVEEVQEVLAVRGKCKLLEVPEVVEMELYVIG